MGNKIKIIKTLPHLAPLFIPQEAISISTNVYSVDTVRFLENIEIYNPKHITFSFLRKFLTETHTLNTHANKSFRQANQVLEVLDFSIRGDIISFWPIGYEHPIRVEFFGEDLEKLYTFDETYGTKIYSQEILILSPYIPDELTEINNLRIKIPNKAQLELEKIITVNSLHGIRYQENFDLIQTDFTMPQLFYSRFDLMKNEIENLSKQGYQVIIKSKSEEQIKEHADFAVEFNQFKNTNKKTTLIEESLEQNLQDIELPAGFISESLRLAVFTDREIFGSIFLTRPTKVSNSKNIQKLLRQLEGSIEIGDYVVHEDYGIGIYSGLTQERIDDEDLEYLLIKYDKEDELYVPLNQIHKITKYIGPEGVEPRITRFGRVSWEHIKQKIKKSASLLAKDLVEHYAKRSLAKAEPIRVKESKEYLAFTDDFKYKPTEDQLRATSEILSDLSSNKPMDRLLVGDVGFGKTEVIMRAAFKVVEDGGQVAVLSPTTVLTDQHFEVFTERFKNFPITIGYISRFKTPKENRVTIDQTNEGKIDILIGTHRLLSDDVKFKKLQLVVVDEEQRFGVKQKEKIKKLNYGVHLLTVSATPIPRTLSMALSSIQSLSIISTPPVNRKPIFTEVIKDNWNKATEAIIKEVQRGGQVYFLHNEVQTIKAIALKLSELTPGIKLAIAHGQMSPDELDRVMAEFYQQKYDCLIATTIIENGLDIPNVNTIIINKAHKFGLSQLYQLRGRVGRAGKQAYCYLMYEGKDITEETTQVQDVKKKWGKRITKTYLERFQSLIENQDLGSGFRIASRDLEIRGAGNLLGDQQSGHISTIGYALYIQILAEEIERIQNLNPASNS
jgi:transcription-repair coupling factor (superfamily II helicase)